MLIHILEKKDMLDDVVLDTLCVKEGRMVMDRMSLDLGYEKSSLAWGFSNMIHNKHTLTQANTHVP